MAYDIELVGKIIREQRLFDAKWYSKRYSITFNSPAELEADFLNKGIFEDRDPNPLFSSAFYRERNEAVFHDRQEPAFHHYITVGAKLGLSPHPFVSVKWVRNKLDMLKLNDEVIAALLHKCAALRLDPNPAFAVDFYLGRYPELLAKRNHPILHYLEYGGKESRNPNPLFWAKWIAKQNGRVITLTEYLENEKLWSISVNPYFNGAEYLNRHLDVAAARVNPLSHYLLYGRFEKRKPNENMDPMWLQEKHGVALRASGLDPLSFLIRYQGKSITANASGALLLSSAGPPATFNNDLTDVFGVPAEAKVDRKRILYVSHNFRMQGAQTSLFELALGTRRYHRTDPIVLAPDDGPMRGLYLGEGVKADKYVLPVAGLADERHYKKLVEGVRAQLKHYAPDVVHGNTVQSYHILAIAAELGIPRVWNIRESEPPEIHTQNLHDGARELFMTALTSNTEFAFVANSTRELWQRSYPEIRANTINNGIDYTRLSQDTKGSGRDAARARFGLSPREVLIFNVGTWTERKGQLDIVRALPMVDRRMWPNLRVILIGANTSSYGREVAREIAQLPKALRERVHVIEETRELAGRSIVLSAYKAADVFVFPSRIESYPRVVNEALYFGLPVISTPCFGAVEQLTEGETGFFYEPDDYNSLARHVQRLVANAGVRQRLAHNASVSARYGLKQYRDMINDYVKIYSALTYNS